MERKGKFFFKNNKVIAKGTEVKDSDKELGQGSDNRNTGNKAPKTADELSVILYGAGIAAVIFIHKIIRILTVLLQKTS